MDVNYADFCMACMVIVFSLLPKRESNPVDVKSLENDEEDPASTNLCRLKVAVNSPQGVAAVKNTKFK